MKDKVIIYAGKNPSKITLYYVECIRRNERKSLTGYGGRPNTNFCGDFTDLASDVYFHLLTNEGAKKENRRVDLSRLVSSVPFPLDRDSMPNPRVLNGAEWAKLIDLINNFYNHDTGRRLI